MSTQITARLPDDLVAFMDELVARDQATSRADVIARALADERRRLRVQRDIEILATTADYDFEGLPDAAHRTNMDDLD
jgi:Arc/MetJ-type ribon-helix-helix transcriptional regulator